MPLQFLALKVGFHVLCSPFPTVAEAVQEKLDSYKAQEDEVKRLKSAMVRRHMYIYFNYTLIHAFLS